MTFCDVLAAQRELAPSVSSEERGNLRNRAIEENNLRKQIKKRCVYVLIHDEMKLVTEDQC